MVLRLIERISRREIYCPPEPYISYAFFFEREEKREKAREAENTEGELVGVRKVGIVLPCLLSCLTWKLKHVV